MRILQTALLIVIAMSAACARPAGIIIDRVAPATGPGLPDGLQRIDYTSAVDGLKDWALALPSSEPTWIVMIHGHGSGGDQLFVRPDIRDTWLPIFRAYGILTVNLRGNAWMSPAAAEDLHALLRQVSVRYRARRFILASGSMGGTSNLIYAVLHPEDVAGVVALCPACDLTSYHRWCLDRPEAPIINEIRQAIETAYGGTPDQRPSNYRAHSALANIGRLNMPVYIAHGAADSIIPVAQSRALAKLAGERRGFRYVEIEGGEHDAPHVKMQEGLSWVMAHLSGDGG